MGSNSLDNLASNGIINFDADAFVRGTEPRYAGKPGPTPQLPLDQPIMDYDPKSYGVNAGSKLHGEPANDAFIRHGESSSHKTNWVKTLLLAAAAALGLSACAKAFAGKKAVKKGKEKVNGFFAGLKDKLPSWAKPKDKAAEEAAKKAAEEAEAAKKVGFLKKIPKWAKYTGGTLAGLFGLYEAYKFITRKKAPEESPGVIPNEH